MQYRLQTTWKATEDVAGMAEYIVEKFKNSDAALSFLDKYDIEVQRLKNFPFGYRGVSFEYRGYEIRIKSSIHIMCFSLWIRKNIVYIFCVY